MSILDKIEEIRKKPEHVRLRYAWVLTAVSMLAIVLVWALSMKSQSYNKKNEPLTKKQQSILNEFQEQKKSLGEATDEIKDVYDESKKIQEEGFGQ